MAVFLSQFPWMADFLSRAPWLQGLIHQVDTWMEGFLIRFPWVQGFFNQVDRVLIEGDRYKLFLRGLGVTLQLSLYAVVLGILLGMTLALMRLSRHKILSGIAGVYIDIMRGTPVVVQLLIFYFVIFGSVRTTNPNFRIIVGSICFGCNSAAYVSEIIRAGILSIDHGQTEAGRSLGLNGFQTMRLIILPQAAKNVIPALGNEFIVLVKETSVFGYIGGVDLTKVGEQIRSKTYVALLPLLIVALIYYLVVKVLTILLRQVERRLRESDRR